MMTEPAGTFGATLRGLLATLLLALALIFLGTGPVAAEDAEALAAQLRAEGYEEVHVERTLLGRIRITARSESHRREIVIDRGTGEILRDLTEALEPAAPQAPEAGDPPSGPGPGD